jgi:CRP/FNR family transcriptional regulator
MQGNSLMLTMTQALQQRVAAMLPFLADERSAIARELAAGASLHHVPAGTHVFMEGDACGAIAILLDGSVRVYKIGETGREITLYRFEHGESCILTANCILSRAQFPAIATTERDTEAIMIPADTFRDWVNRYPPWRDYLFTLLSQRLATVMTVVDEVAFRRMDARIAEFLLQRAARDGDALRVTHQEIAAELGTSREVVSRIMQDFAAAGVIETSRGTITLKQHDLLASRSK